ncbi:NAD-dependent epimerase/dehydratase family protein [Asanoa sp. WMMD1127]|uniref:NAD-dependent epimerase/dehydratase family protein n=1 Tax=Asanoa sp. WMMD1127 TaxID=3016107 RepID=UPI002417300C|nr:NAD-dependent epimerase/dehydratase family protein [Asanoa sp. WMMD1127]MDG4824574.1 NAD-dependent epimerase/dehydratase family protein [Asanoa sp. WMMD1127]
MKVVVVGASGNVGSAVLRRLAQEPDVTGIVGVARRVPKDAAGPPYAGVDWWSIDVAGPGATGALTEAVRGAAVVIHVAWQIQPSHDAQRLRRTNVQGTANVAVAAIRAGVPALVVASSVGAYAPGPKDERVGEWWPVTGVRWSSYSRDKAHVERLLDEVERGYPALRVVRMRPALTFQRAAASEIARLFIGPFAPLGLLRYGRLPVVPGGPRLRVQGVHADDVADAYVRAALADVRGAFNLAADPVLDGPALARRYHGRVVPLPVPLLRAAAGATWWARLQPIEAGWIDLATGVPLLSSDRAAAELGWTPRIDALSAIDELFTGMADRAGAPTAALRERLPFPARLAALAAGRLPGHGDPY